MFNIEKFNEIRKILEKNNKKGKIIAISKNHPLESILEAISQGVHIFGENRVQEAKAKFVKIKADNPKIKLHLTGPLQSNKVKDALSVFDVFHTIDREKIAIEFSKYQSLLKDKKFLVQVNTGKEITKSGIFPEHTKDFLLFLKNEINLAITGLMCIPPVEDDPKYHFNKLQNLAIENGINELSIGMSGDYNEAIPFKPAYIRLGTILFGERNWKIK